MKPAEGRVGGRGIEEEEDGGGVGDGGEVGWRMEVGWGWRVRVRMGDGMEDGGWR